MKRLIRGFIYKIRNYHYIKGELKKILLKIEKSKDKHKIFLFQTPTHSNIGDHIIAIAQIDFLKLHRPNCEVIEINQSVMKRFILKYKTVVKSFDAICLIGGGNFGNEYLFEENLRRLVVKNYPNNKIIIFPQTIDYSDDFSGRDELKQTQNIFKHHKDLTITAREEVSYELVEKYFPFNKVILTPDIVLSMHKRIDVKREYALGVIRQDQESILSDNLKSKIKSLLNENYENVVFSDMHVENFKSVKSAAERDNVVENKLLQFAKAKIVITDRLHGMVLAAITGTPCIAFSNYNQKVSGTYSWLKELKYIKYVENEEQLLIVFNELSKLTTFESYNSKHLEHLFEPLVKTLKQ